MRWEYLSAMQTSGSATRETGWDLRIVTLWSNETANAELVAACPLYLKPHSYGEYVFDHAWANAYAQHGLDYYPKAVVAVPFTPVPGTRLLAQDDAARVELVLACQALCEATNASSLHLLFTSQSDRTGCIGDGASSFMPRDTVQFHWTNRADKPYASFDDFLKILTQDKRKKIKQERRKVLDVELGAGVVFRHSQGSDILDSDWDFFYACYERTYLEHGNAPYLTRNFFRSMASDMPENWLLFIGEIEGERIASSLIAIQNLETTNNAVASNVAYGRYWGATLRVDCLHFEACYYQPLAWCISNGYHRFEGGAQGEHKMARALLPVTSTSMHHIQHPQFSKAIERFLDRERAGVADYQLSLEQRSPLK
jgi:predicted N-acyltransferase